MERGKRRLAALAGIAALAFCHATAAAAIDSVTGTYEGKITCRQIAKGLASKTKGAVVVEVREGKGGFASADVIADGTPIATALLGFLAEDGAKTDRAKVAAIECGYDFLEREGATFHADIVIKPGSEKGTLKGTLLDMDDAVDAAGICTFTAKRTSTAEPDVTLCL